MITEAQPGAAASLASGRILIVDDVAENRDVLARRLRHRGYEAVEAAGGQQALDLIEREPFDVILLDMMMPDVDGLEVLRRVRERHSLAALPVIMVTAKTQPEDIVGALAAEANDYITKPLDFDVVLARVDTQIRRKQVDEGVRRANDDLERQLAVLRDNCGRGQGPSADFLADMGHELRTPLNGVIGIAGALAGTELQPKQKELVQIIESSAATLERLLSDLLDQGKAASGRLEIKGETFALGAEIRAVASLWEARAREKNIGFELVLPADADGDVHGDPVRLKQIITNLLSNAVKFTSQGAVRMMVSRTDEQHCFAVTDSGIGFDAAVKDRLFARFEQADASISKRFGGTGLGLAISRELAQLMDGSLDAVSAPGQGATFTLVLPLLRMEARAAQPQTPTDVVQNGEPRALRVLYADDHPVNRQVVKLMLAATADGTELTCVEDGQQAVDAFRTGAFDLILMDVQMPVMDGLTATRTIREIEAAEGLAAIPIIVLTAHNLPEHLRASAQAGADGHLGKPVNAAQLLSTIAEHGARSRVAGAASPAQRAAG